MVKKEKFKSGDLVLCMFQPKTSHVNDKGEAVRMKYKIKGELGVLIKNRDLKSGYVFFPSFLYTHCLNFKTLKKL